MDEALSGLLDHQLDITRLFSVGVDILNASRALDTMAFELQLLARNGVVQAAQMNHAAAGTGNGDGQSLLALAEILSNCPREIGPSLVELGDHCRTVATHTAHCMSLARRHTQHLKALLLVLGRETDEAKSGALMRLLGTTSLRAEQAASRLLSVADDGGMSTTLRANLDLIAARCLTALQALAGHLADTAACLRATDDVLHTIGRVAGTVNYLGINVAIEAAHCDERGANFRQLASDIEATVQSLVQKLAAIRDSAARGRKLIKLLEGRQS